LQPNNEQYSNPKKSVEVKFIKSKVVKTEEEWKKTLSQEEYHILRQKGTEQAFTGKYLKNKKKGIYLCAACENELFSSDTKFDSGTGWPSFWAPVNENNVETEEDNRFGMKRIEVTCAKCGGHLGHVFDDSPTPTGQRFCINSTSLKFNENKK
jgi:peptide-methionine (R)-S-oxide reductase